MGKKLEAVLQEKKAEILEKWENSILGRFAPDTFHIFKNQKDQFANPVGHKVRSGLSELFDVLCDTSDKEVITPDLEQLIKMRAVQEVSASEAVSFVFKLKSIARKELKKEKTAKLYHDWLALDARIDAAALAIFDMFMASKEQLYKVRISEFQHGRNLLTDGAVCPSKLVRRDMEEAAAESGNTPGGEHAPIHKPVQ